MPHRVDPTGTCSNRGDLADLPRRARQWVREDRQGPVQNPKPGLQARPNWVVPQRVADRLGENIVREMIEARQYGAKLRDLAERYGISESNLKRLLRKPPLA